MDALCGRVVLALLLFAPALAGPDAWSETAAWLAANGAEVDSLLRANVTSHGGASIRGVVSGARLGPAETLLRVPRKLWLTLEHFPELQRANLSKVPACVDLPGTGKGCSALKEVAAIAAETRKGDASFFAPYLRTLPTLAEIRSFHPLYAGTPIVADFGALSIVTYALRVQFSDNQTRDCFEAWRRSPERPSALAGLSWGDYELALAWFRTRSYSVGLGEGALIPGSDLLNTAKRRSLNTAWSPDGGVFTLRTSASVPAGAELFDTYCSTCDNERMLTNWGVYLEDNPNALSDNKTKLIDCDAVNFLPGEGTADTLREAAEAALDLSPTALSEARAEGWRSPRCRRTLASPQGPLRCSLARLAWEYCGRQWGSNASVPPAMTPATLLQQTGRRLRRGTAS